MADGAGATRNNGLGLLGMQERVRLVDGKCVVVPEPGKGTLVRVRIPFHPVAARAAQEGRQARPARRLPPSPQSNGKSNGTAPKLLPRSAKHVPVQLNARRRTREQNPL